jgi:hypothetical protein
MVGGKNFSYTGKFVMKIMKNHQKGLGYPIYQKIQEKVFCYDCEQLINEKGLYESAKEIDNHIKDSKGICQQMEIKTIWNLSKE